MVMSLRSDRGRGLHVTERRDLIFVQTSLRALTWAKQCLYLAYEVPKTPQS